MVEIVATLFICVMVGSAVLGALLSTHQLSQHAGHAMKAVSDMDDMMEHIHATSFNTIQTTFPAGVPNGGDVTNYAALVDGYTLDGEQITVTYPSRTPTRIEVLVTLNWTERGRARTIQLSTVRTS